MRKIIVFTLLLVIIPSLALAGTNWSKFQSNRNNIGLEGYQSQPGYVAFYDGEGNLLGYMWWSEGTGQLVYCTADAIDLTTTELSDYYGVNIGTNYADVVP